MTRVTKLKRKTFEEASGFSVTPLLPAKSEVTSIPDTTHENHDESNVQKSSGKKRRFNKNKEGVEGSVKEQKEVPVQPSSRAQRRKMAKFKNTVCFACRKTGHPVSECPNSGSNLCYNCGALDHASGSCPLPVDKSNPYPFATCFVCNEKGHIAGACPKNENGLYPNGGGCKYCGSKTHYAKDCKPVKQGKDTGNITLGMIDAHQGGDDDDVFIALKKMSQDEKMNGAHQKSRVGPKGATGANSVQMGQPMAPVAVPKKKVVKF